MNRRTLTVDIDGEERTVEYRDTSSFRFKISGETEDTAEDRTTTHSVRALTVEERTGDDIRTARDITKEHVQAAIDASLESVEWVSVRSVEVEEHKTKRMWASYLNDEGPDGEPVEVDQ